MHQVLQHSSYFQEANSIQKLPQIPIMIQTVSETTN